MTFVVLLCFFLKVSRIVSTRFCTVSACGLVKDAVCLLNVSASGKLPPEIQASIISMLSQEEIAMTFIHEYYKKMVQNLEAFTQEILENH